MDKDYLEELRKRSKKSKVYKQFQLFGLEIAEILGDDKHKSLYIKMARENDPRELLSLAKRVAESHGIRNKGAYFMKLVTEELRVTSIKAKTEKKNGNLDNKKQKRG